MKRTDVINHLIQKHGFKRYLEIGLNDSTQNFDKIQCDYKISVDPDPNAMATYCITSDEFFINWRRVEVTCKYDNGKKKFVDADTDLILFDCIFLDGEHSEEQLEKDFYNALKILSHGGCIIMHDTSPESEDLTHFPRDKKGSWNGSCYKFASRVSSISFFTVDIDHGVSVYKNDDYPLIVRNEVITWKLFNKKRKELLNLITFEQFINTHPLV